MNARIRKPRGIDRKVVGTSESGGVITFSLSCGHSTQRPASKWGVHGHRSDPNLERIACPDCTAAKAKS
jgi:hypothetical protein